jgi:hypothetical protein
VTTLNYNFNLSYHRERRFNESEAAISPALFIFHFLLSVPLKGGKGKRSIIIRSAYVNGKAARDYSEHICPASLFERGAKRIYGLNAISRFVFLRNEPEGS